MNGRIFSAAFSAQAETAAISFFELQAPADMTINLVACHVGQTTEFGDAAAELLGWNIVRGHGTVTSGSGGVASTEEPLHKGGSAAGAVVEHTNTTRLAAGTGTLHTMHADTFHVAAGLHWEPPQELWIPVSPSDFIDIGLIAAPADSITWTGTVWWEELGG